MCLAIPGQILRWAEAQAHMAEVRFGDVSRTICTVYVPEAVIGDFVIVHAGFAITRLNEAEAERSLALLAELESASD